MSLKSRALSKLSGLVWPVDSRLLSNCFTSSTGLAAFHGGFLASVGLTLSVETGFMFRRRRRWFGVIEMFRRRPGSGIHKLCIGPDDSRSPGLWC